MTPYESHVRISKAPPSHSKTPTKQSLPFSVYLHYQQLQGVIQKLSCLEGVP